VKAQTFELNAKTFTYPAWYHYSYADPKNPGNVGQLGQTRWGLKPNFANTAVLNGKTIKFARLELRTYHPNAPARYFMGTTIVHNKPFGLPKLKNGTLVSGATRDFEAVMRFPYGGRRQGIVSGFFPYLDPPERRNEIDYEILHNLLKKNQLWVNAYENGDSFDDDPYGLDGPDKQVSYASHIHGIGADASTWVRYKIKWGSKAVQWELNSTPTSRPFYEINSPEYPIPDPNKQMRVHFNIWAPGPEGEWSAAVGEPADDPLGLIKPTVREQNKTYYYDVHRLTVSSGRVRGRPIRRGGR
jgi:hypothetical protein